MPKWHLNLIIKKLNSIPVYSHCLNKVSHSRRCFVCYFFIAPHPSLCCDLASWINKTLLGNISLEVRSIIQENTHPFRGSMINLSSHRSFRRCGGVMRVRRGIINENWTKIYCGKNLDLQKKTPSVTEQIYHCNRRWNCFQIGIYVLLYLYSYTYAKSKL